jgi:hypothetical protein
MRRGMMAWLLVVVTAMPVAAQQAPSPDATPAVVPDEPSGFLPEPGAAVEPVPADTPQESGALLPPPWFPVWGLVGLRAIPEGAKVAPNGVRYHPNFSLDLDLNFWVWRSQGIYMFSDLTLWGEGNEDGVTNGRDGWLGTSKRQFDFSGGAAWNYVGPWEARFFGYTDNNLNRGTSLEAPTGFLDGFGMENRYYLSPEYARLGQTGFDVARATFLSVGYYPSKNMVGNDGLPFAPGMMLRAYLTYDLWDWRCYAYGDATYISKRSFDPKLLLFDLGLAIRPFSSFRQCEFRLGADNTADLQVGNVLSLWYLAFRFIY